MGRCIPQTHASNDEFVIDYEAELSHWRTHYRSLPGCAHLRMDDVRPAIKVALDACLRARGRGLEQMWDALQARYQRLRERSCMEWPQARGVIEAVWTRVHERVETSARGADMAAPAHAALAWAPVGRMRLQALSR